MYPSATDFVYTDVEVGCWHFCNTLEGEADSYLTKPRVS
jgi:hypothetical protein